MNVVRYAGDGVVPSVLDRMELGYTNLPLIKALIANSLMSKTEDTIDQLGDVLNIGNTIDYNLVTPTLLATFAQDARMDIDAKLSGLYVTPLRKVADLEVTLLASTTLHDNASNANPSDGSSGPSVTDSMLLSSEASALSPGDWLIITDGDQKENVQVDSVLLSTAGVTVTVTAFIFGTYLVGPTTRVVRFDYPAAIKFIATRLTTANLFDKLFTAQADKNESQYGKFFRQLARQQLNDILAGATVLHGQRRNANLNTPPNFIKPVFPQMGAKGEPYKLEDPGRGG
jgi:hypothetical protein